VLDLPAKIAEALGTIITDMLQQTWAELNYRLDILHVTNGAHVQVYWFFKLNFVCCVTYLSILRTYLYSLLRENMIKSGNVTLYNSVAESQE
jgi:hypothetical protein